MSEVLTYDGFTYFANKMLDVVDTKVDADGNKVLSDYNFGTVEKTNCEKVPNIETTISQLQGAIEDLQFVPISVTALTCTPATAEKGSTVNVVLAWTTNKAPTTLKLNGTDVTGTDKGITGVTADQSYSLAATDAKGNSSTKSATITFLNQIYYGVAANSGSITTLTKTLSGVKARDITVDAGSGEYIYYAYPKRLGVATFSVGGFAGGFETAETKSLTNASGFTEDYYVYRSGRSNLGNTTVTIK